MHIHKSLHWILGIVGALLIFGAGFYIGTLDADAHEIKITSQCAGIGVAKSFASNYESVNGTVVRDETKRSESYTARCMCLRSESYTARCMCFASDATHKNIWVDTVEFTANTMDGVRNLCNSDCQKLCEGRLANFTFAE